MKQFGTISYNLYCNFTNYGSALQTWALHQAIKKLGHNPILVDYCPKILMDRTPLNPFRNMWDNDKESKKMVELTMPAIESNYLKYIRFFREQLRISEQKYVAENFKEIVREELDGFVCGSDTIFCPDEFGFDDGYFANFSVMKGNSVSYAASFGDPHFTKESYILLKKLLSNFKALGIREQQMIPFIKDSTSAPVERVIDPTLLLTAEEYEPIISSNCMNEKYLLLYSRRYSPQMEMFARNLASKNGWKVVEISLRATNETLGHIMRYDAGVEEFLSLVKYSEFVVTNSYHGMIFGVQFRRPFVVFSREQCDNKIKEILDLFGLTDRIFITGHEEAKPIDFDAVHDKIEEARINSNSFLQRELELL